MTVKTTLTELREVLRPTTLRRSYPRLLCLMLVYPVLAALLSSWLDAAFPAILVILFTEVQIQRYIRNLRARAESEESVTWDVEINKVRVGAITDSSYAQIRLQAFTDSRTYYAQAANAMRVAFVALDRCLVVIPFAFFWGCVAMIVISPNTLATELAAIQAASPADLWSAAGKAVEMVPHAMVLVLTVHWLLGLRLGLRNRFEESIAAAVRTRCGVPAEGEVVLSRIADGTRHFGNELATLRKRD